MPHFKVVTHRGIDKRGIVAPCVLLVSKHFYPCGIYLGDLLSCLPELGSLLLTPCVSLVVVEIPVGWSFFNSGVHGASVHYPIVRPVEDWSVRWERLANILACLPSSAHLSASSFRGSPRWALILMKMVRRPCSILSRKSWMISRIISAVYFRGVCWVLSTLNMYSRLLFVPVV